jgi:hypothetical protein
MRGIRRRAGEAAQSVEGPIRVAVHGAQEVVSLGEARLPLEQGLQHPRRIGGLPAHDVKPGRAQGAQHGIVIEGAGEGLQGSLLVSPGELIDPANEQLGRGSFDRGG